MDTGWKARLDILKRDLEEKIFSKLKMHGWTTVILREVQQGDYLIAEVRRGGIKKKIALMFSAGTANSIYLSIQNEVDHIFVNGSLASIESFNRGITIPITQAADFQHCLIEWNELGIEGPFQPSNIKIELDDEDDYEVSDTDVESNYTRIQSEHPLQIVWIHLRQLESVTLARKNITLRAKKESIKLSDEVLISKSEGLAFALRNATDYYRTAEGRNLNQRILNLYYGTLSFSFAEMLSSPRGPSTLSEIELSTKQGHGLFTLDGKDDNLESSIIGVQKNGFYSRYLQFLEHNIDFCPSKKPKELAELPLENSSWVTFEGLLSRIPEISDLYQNIFSSRSGWLDPVYDHIANNMGYGSSGIKPQKTYIQLIDHSGRWKKEEILKLLAPFSSISEPTRKDGKQNFRVLVNHEGHDLFWNVLDTHRSPIKSSALIEPVFGNVREFRAINLAILYALSIVVRYRPSLWRRVQEGDLDYMRVLIEAYLDVIERILPEHYLGRITGKTVVTKQPGSMF